MKKIVLAIITGALFALSSHASVSITFTNDLQGFSTLGLLGGGTVAWAANNGTTNGGSMQLINDSSVATYHPDMVRLQIQKNPALWNELLRAETNGGLLQYDVIIRNIDQDSTYGASIQVICTSGNELGDNWVNQNAFTTIPIGGTGTTTKHITMPITTSGASGDGSFIINPAATAAFIDFGINSDLTTNVVYIDNVKITAFNAPSAADITFNSNLQGFVAQWGGGTFGWSSVNGGSMGLTNGNNWVGDMVQLPMTSNPGFWANITNSLARGGIISWDAIYKSSDIDFTPGSGAYIMSQVTSAYPLLVDRR